MMKSTFFRIARKTILLGSILIIGSCSSDNGDNEDEITDSDPISAHFGEFVKIPDFNETTGLASELMATDKGLYITVGSTESQDDWVYRYDLNQNDILKGTWQKIQYNPTSDFDFFETKAPLQWKSESTSEHEILITPTYYAFETPVYQTINLASGTVVNEEDAPVHNFSYVGGGTYESYGNIIKDDFGQDWAVFQGGTVSDNNLHVIKLRYGKLPFNDVCSITAEGPLVYSASLSSTSLYALSYDEKKLYIIKTNGDVLIKDLSPYYDDSKSLFEFYKNKFRFSSTGVYFQYQDKVFKLIDDENLTLFYTIKYSPETLSLGDFCVDNDYLFATDGTRKELSGFYKEVNIIPQAPSTSNQEILLDYIQKVNFFKQGELETSTNSSDKYIYILGQNGKILVISKHYL